MTDAQLTVLLQMIHKMLEDAINGVRIELPDEMKVQVKTGFIFNPDQTREEFPILDGLYEVLNQLENGISQLKIPLNLREDES